MGGATPDTVQHGLEAAVNAAGVAHGSADAFILYLTIFVLATFLGRYAARRPLRALRLPLTAAAAAISCVSFAGALIAVGARTSGIAAGFGFAALVLTGLVATAGILVARRLLDAQDKPDR